MRKILGEALEAWLAETWSSPPIGQSPCCIAVNPRILPDGHLTLISILCLCFFVAKARIIFPVQVRNPKLGKAL